jgi:DNA-binding GntR family transcriptional regulator
MVTMLQSRVRLLRWTSLSVPGRSQETVGEVRAIVMAIEAKDAEAAATAAALHVRNAAAMALARISESPEPLGAKT